MKTFALVIIAAVLLAIVGWWIAFGTLSPCESLRGEVRRVAQAQAGILGKAVAGAYADFKADAYTPAQCVGKAIRLKVGGKDALGEVLKD